MFDVSPAWVRRLKQRRWELGTIAPLPGRYGRPWNLTEDHLRRLRELVEQHPDATLRKRLAGRVGRWCKWKQAMQTTEILRCPQTGNKLRFNDAASGKIGTLTIFGERPQWPQVKALVSACEEPEGLQTAQPRAKRRPEYRSHGEQSLERAQKSLQQQLVPPLQGSFKNTSSTQGFALGISAFQAEEP